MRQEFYSHGSLSYRIARKYGDLQVMQVSCGYQMPDTDTRYLLNTFGIGAYRPFVRCVQLHAGGALRICATTTLVGQSPHLLRLVRLKEMPIGWVLFGKGGKMQRAIFIARTYKEWTRHSLYRFGGGHLVISETFM